MRVLITGGFGYLGGRLGQFLATQANTEVILGSRRPLSAPSWLAQAKTATTRWDDSTALEEMCTNVDAIVHMAGMNARSCAADPVAALEFNGVATARLLQASIRRHVRRFVYLSTAHVYAPSLTGVITESTCPVSTHPYATSHRAGEDAVRYAQQGGLTEGVVVRLSNAFGAPAHESTDAWILLVNDLCRQAVATGRLELSSTGTQRRDFIPLPDACAAIQHLLLLPKQDLADGLFNVGGRWAPTVWEMAQFIQQRCRVVLGFEPDLVRVEAAPGTPVAPLEYGVDRLRAGGFELRSEPADEIDGLLSACQKWFTR